MVDALRMAPGTRRTLQVVGPVLFVLGLGLFFWGGYLMMSGGGDPGSDTFMDDAQSNMVRTAAYVVPGMLLFVVGFALTVTGFRKPLSELAATDTEVAVEHSSAAMGRGLAKGMGEGKLSRGRDNVKVKCRSCGFLESEDARFCSSCSKPI